MVQTRPGSGDPVARLVLPSRAFCLSFSPFPHSSNLLAAGLQSSVTVGITSFSEETASGEFSWSVLQEIHHDTRVQALAWSPKSNLLASPKLIEFATSATDHKVRLFTSDLENVSVKVLKGHTDYVNSLVWEPEAGQQLVTGSDDQTVRLWEDGECVSTLHFKSPVMSVAWHQEEVGKLLIGLKSGVVCLYNAVTLQPILSLASHLSPLLDMDWSSSNSLMVSAVGGSDLAMMDMSSPSAPLVTRTVHSDGARHVSATDNLVATAGRPGNSFKVWHGKSGVLLLSNDLVIIGGLSWHQKLPYLAVGGDREVQLYKVTY